MAEKYILDAGQVFTLFFVMLGPLKMLGAFAKATQKMSRPELKKFSWEAAGFALASLLIGGFLGSFLLSNWGIPVAVLELTAGVIFLLMALMMLLGPHKEESAASSEAASPILASRVALSMIVTPYGMAAIVVLLTDSQSLARTSLIVGLLVGVMILNLLSMFFVRQLTGKVITLMMAMIGAVLGVLQAALAVQIIFVGFKHL